MVFTGIYNRIALAALAIIAGLSSARAQDVCGVILSNRISMSGSSFIDSFDSTNPYKSTNGLYDPAKRQMHGDLCVMNTIGADLRNCFVYGDLEYSGSPIKNTSNVQGTISTPFSSTIPSATDPAWAAGEYTTYAGGGAPAFVTVTASHVPTRIKVEGDFTVQGGKSVSIVAAEYTDCYIEIWVTGKLTVSGGGKITQDPLVHATWIVDKDITATGDSYNNWSGNASNLSFIGVNSGKVNISGYGNFIATIDAPGRDLIIGGGAAISGGMVGNTLTISGSSSIHFDEALR